MQLEVQTTAGRVRGRERRGVALFAGIPYAAPPTGALRFEAPQPAAPWEGVLDATSFGPAAPQNPGEGLTNAGSVDWAEDCLSLNVCTPAADEARRPVMVWIHGGAYRHGTGATPWYDGTSFATVGDVVTVTINYRLGALGFARLPGAPTSGINGTLDQIGALGWVRDNIAAFGGDPDQVTVAGESAGAFSVATLCTMPSANGLFGRAIAQSGAGHHVLPIDEADQAAQRLLAHMGLASVDEARVASVEDVLAAQLAVEGEASSFLSAGQVPFYPSVTTGFLDGHPIDLMTKGAGAAVTMLTGTNTDETSLFGMNRVSAEKLDAVLAHYATDPAPMVAAVLEDRGDIDAGAIAMAVSTDYSFRIPAIRMAEAREAHGATTYMYEFDWKSQAFDGMLGSCHALEIPFTFNTVTGPGVELFLGTDAIPTHVANTMHHAWIAFIRSGDPECDQVGNWPPYTGSTRAVARFADQTELVLDPWPNARAAWAGHR